MKKTILFLMVLTLVLTLGLVAYADSVNELPQWFNDMMVWRRARVEEALDAGAINDGEAKAWRDRMDYMEEYYRENDFTNEEFFGPCCGNYGLRRGPGHGRHGRGLGLARSMGARRGGY